MKKSFLSLAFALVISTLAFSQTSTNTITTIKPLDEQLRHIDSVPDYAAKKQPFVLSGILYLEDGVTPAVNHILTINQADDNGDYVFSKVGKHKILKHRAQVVTNADGKYAFYTFIPGGDRLYNQLREIYIKVETPEGMEYALPTLFFDNDPFLSKRCRKKLIKRQEQDRILKLNKTNGKQYVTKMIVISKSDPLQ